MNFSSHIEGAVISSAEFHPLSTVGLVAGNKVLCDQLYRFLDVQLFSLQDNVTLSQIDCKENLKIQTINFKDFPIKTARFSASGNEFIVGSKFHPHFFVYDMLAGQTVKVQYCERFLTFEIV